MTLDQERPGAGPRPAWDLRVFRWLPPLLVLLTVLWIVVQVPGPLLANHWAYPATLFGSAVVAAALVIRGRPRRTG
jgi:hypothetical protein